MSRWHTCNVLRGGNDGLCLWRFGVSNNDVQFQSELGRLPGETLPGKLVRKDWANLWLRKLNIAWLPADQVFLRVVQLPAAEPSEVVPMVELQLEKLSPIPPAQTVWSIEVLPRSAEATAPLTVILLIVERSAVEAYLGGLEKSGFEPDRLEIPLLTTLLSTKVTEDGAWLYPAEVDGRCVCLVAWWQGGQLQNLHLARLPEGDAAKPALEQELLRLAWAGETEGWLTGPVRLHLVAATEIAAKWEGWLTSWTPTAVSVHPAPAPAELAAVAARRAIRGEAKSNLLPVETAARYRQQFIDKLWMRALTAVAAIYLVCVLVYLGALQVLQYQKGRLDLQLAEQSGAYTNALQLKARVQVLQEQVHLKFAALDCLRTTAELLPTELTLVQFSFQNGKTLSFQGTAPADATMKITDFNSEMKKADQNGASLFGNVTPASITLNAPAASGAGDQSARWSFTAELKVRD